MKKFVCVSVFFLTSGLIGFSLGQSNPFTVKPGKPTPVLDKALNGIFRYDQGFYHTLGTDTYAHVLIAARFPVSLTSQYAGYYLKSIQLYITDLPAALILKVYSSGTDTTAGLEIYSKNIRDITNPNSFNLYTLDQPVLINGGDIWIGYEIVMTSGQYSIGMDDGPVNPNGDWLLDFTACQCWYHLSDFNIFNNWVIRGYVNKFSAGEESSTDQLLGETQSKETAGTGGNVSSLSTYKLEQNYPNPFNPSTTIQFSLPEDAQNVKLMIYNSVGERVAELVNTGLAAGTYSYSWNAEKLSSGIYIYQLVTDNFVSTKNMILLK